MYLHPCLCIYQTVHIVYLFTIGADDDADSNADSNIGSNIDSNADNNNDNNDTPSYLLSLDDVLGHVFTHPRRADHGHDATCALTASLGDKIWAMAMPMNRLEMEETIMRIAAAVWQKKRMRMSERLKDD